jgi:hypothetical protein
MIPCCGSFLFIPRAELLSFSRDSARREHRMTSFYTVNYKQRCFVALNEILSRTKVKVKIYLLQAMEAHRVKAPKLLRQGKVVSPTRRPHFTPRFLYFFFFKDSWYSFLLEAESTPGP